MRTVFACSFKHRDSRLMRVLNSKIIRLFLMCKVENYKVFSRESLFVMMTSFQTSLGKLASLWVTRSHWAPSTGKCDTGRTSAHAGSTSSSLLKDELSGARITLKIVAQTRLTARQKFNWCATGISLKFTTWMRRKYVTRRNGKKNMIRKTHMIMFL